MQQEEIATVTASGLRLFLLSLLVLAVALGCLVILTPFLAAIAWAAILAYTSWPFYKKIRRPFGRRESAAAFTMTLLLTCAVVLPILWVAALAGGEIVVEYRAATNFLAQKPHALPAFIRDIPWLGAQLQQQIDRFSAEPAALGGQFIQWMQSLAGQLTAFMSGIGRNLGKLLVAMVTVYFLYRDGDSIVLQCHWVAKRFFADRIDPYLRTITTMTRAVVYGLVLTAIAQGLIAGIGYAIVGLETAALLGALTGVLSVVPVLGTGLVWGSLGVSLLMTGHLWKGIFLLIWGTVLVHPTDNLLRATSHQQRDQCTVSGRHVRRHRRTCRVRLGGSISGANYSRDRACRLARVGGAEPASALSRVVANGHRFAETYGFAMRLYVPVLGSPMLLRSRPCIWWNF